MRRSVALLAYAAMALVLGCSDAESVVAPAGGPAAKMRIVDASYCGEALCTPVMGNHRSRFEGDECRGTETYSVLSRIDSTERRSWNAQGLAGTTKRTVFNKSYREPDGRCYPFPSGFSESEMVTIYRKSYDDSPPPCEESVCLPAVSGWSEFASVDCSGTEYGDRTSWDGGGVSGTVVRTVAVGSYRTGDGICQYWGWRTQEKLRVYRAEAPRSPYPCGEQICRGAVTRQQNSFYRTSDCTSGEYGAYVGHDPAPGSWDGGGLSGTYVEPDPVFHSFRQTNGTCSGSTTDIRTLGYVGGIRTYRDTPPSVSISGPDRVRRGMLCFWWAPVSGGQPPFTYQWTGALSGTEAYISGQLYSSGDLFVTVTDAQGRTASATQHFIMTSIFADC